VTSSRSQKFSRLHGGAARLLRRLARRRRLQLLFALVVGLVLGAGGTAVVAGAGFEHEHSWSQTFQHDGGPGDGNHD
jgi:hypothetical protein